MAVTGAEATSSGCACYRSFVFSGSCLVLLCTKKGRVRQGQRGRFSGELLRVGANTKGQASAACLRSESLRSARALWGATLRFYLCFDFFSSPHFFRSLFFSFVSSCFGFCFVLFHSQKNISTYKCETNFKQKRKVSPYK